MKYTGHRWRDSTPPSRVPHHAICCNRKVREDASPPAPQKAEHARAKTGCFTGAIISGVAHEGLTITTLDGRRARLAVNDEDANIVEASPGVEREAWNVAIAVLKNFPRGQGHLRVHSHPPNSPGNCKRSAT